MPFVDKVLAIRRVKSNIFLGKTWKETLDFVIEKGGAWNVGNPWKTSTLIYDRLRAKLGYWRAIGASDSVISWLGYGVPMRFKDEPRHYMFKNHKMDKEAKEYVEKDLEKHLESGCFKLAPKESVKSATQSYA